MASVHSAPDKLLAHLVHLGKRPDSEVAELAGVNVDEVKARRRELGIPPFLRPPPGSEPAVSAAPSAPASGSVVIRRRNAKNGSRTEVSRSVLEWPSDRHTDADANAGGVTDTRETGASPGGKPLGRPEALEARKAVPDSASPSRSPRPAPVQPPSNELMRVMMTPPLTPSVRTRRSSVSPILHLLGTRPDAELADLTKTTVANIRNHRERRGIPSFRTPSIDSIPAKTAPLAQATPPTVSAPARKKPGRRTPIDAYAHLLGTVPDAEVARLSGASPAAVGQYRARRKIVPFRPAQAPGPNLARQPTPVGAEPGHAVAPVPTAVAAEPAPAYHAVAATTPGLALAVKVVAIANDEKRVFLVVADDIVQAARIAVEGLAQRSDGPWQIRKLRVVGDGLR